MSHEETRPLATVEPVHAPYEAPSVERVVTADELTREAQYAGGGSGTDTSSN
jgi:hypothetical protein